MIVFDPEEPEQDVASSVEHDASSPAVADGIDTHRILVVMRVMVCLVAIAFVAVLIRVVQLQKWPSESLGAHRPNTVSVREELARRGDLLDRRGRVLASTRLGYRLFVDPSLVDDVTTVAIDIAELLNVNPVPLDRRLQERMHTKYAVMIPLLEDTQVETIRSARLKGVGLEQVPVRHQPYGELGSQIIGIVGADHIGLSGMEYRFRHELKAHHGELRYLRDASRRAMWIESGGYDPGRDGLDLRLSIDLELQRIAEEELNTQLEAYNAGGGRLIVLDPRSGELLAMADILRDRTDREPFSTDEDRKIAPGLGRIRCVSDPYEPGSTFKPFIWAKATELGRAQPDEMFDTHLGRMRMPGAGVIRDSHPYEELDWEMVLVKSSNIGMAQVAVRMSEAEVQKAVWDFGFGRSSGSGLPGESNGLVTAKENWNLYSQTRVSYGHEIAVTPLQLVRAFSAFARDGSLPIVRILAGRRDDGVPAAWIEQRPISESVALQTRYVMHRVMLEGTGRGAHEGAKYRMFGKSGTAEMPNFKEGGYYRDRYVINFIAGAPLEDPRLVVLCVIEDPDPSIGHYGGAVCGPVVRDVMNRALTYLGVPSDLESEAETESEIASNNALQAPDEL